MKNLVFSKEDHKYYWNGSEVPSVTTILKQSHDFSYATKADREYGRIVHETTEKLDRKEVSLNDYVGDLGQRLKAWEYFLKSFALRPIQKLIELQVYHDLYEYAGTIDRVLISKTKELYLVDIKTGVLDDYVNKQLAAYAMALIRTYPCFGKRKLYVCAVRLMSSGGLGVKFLSPGQYFSRFLQDLGKYKKEKGVL